MKRAIAMATFAMLASCTRFGAVYPPRPAETPNEALSDPTPSRVVVHATVTSSALKKELEAAVPRSGDGTFSAIGGDRSYTWTRDDFDVDFAQGRVSLATKVHGSVKTPIVGTLDFTLDLRVSGEPVVNSEFGVKLQGIDVQVGSDDHRLHVANKMTPIFEKISGPIKDKLKQFSFSLRPLLEMANERFLKPKSFPVGGATACAKLRVLGIEMGPTVLADGIEKDIAFVVAPQVTLPCVDEEVKSDLPVLANVATLQPGPFTVTIPVAAKYDELTKAMSATFTDGKYFFSKEYPGLYLEDPYVYESEGLLVAHVHLKGPAHSHGIDADLDGDVYFSGHPQVVDNELSIPDLEPTIETSSFFLALKAAADGTKIRDQARAALRLDIGERLRAVRDTVNDDLSFGNERGCFRGSIDKIDVKEIHAHASYLRVYVAVTARANVTIPCQTPQP